MALEIERKFLVDGEPDVIADIEGQPIEQGYLAVLNGEREVRVRCKADQAVLTVKLGSGRDREEVEIDLSEEQFEALWPLTEGIRLAKTRFEVPHQGLTIEIDVYGKPLDGMVVAEVEFESDDASDEFTPPPWFGVEVTGDRRYANESLALHGRPEGG